MAWNLGRTGERDLMVLWRRNSAHHRRRRHARSSSAVQLLRIGQDVGGVQSSDLIEASGRLLRKMFKGVSPATVRMVYSGGVLTFDGTGLTSAALSDAGESVDRGRFPVIASVGRAVFGGGLGRRMTHGLIRPTGSGIRAAAM